MPNGHCGRIAVVLRFAAIAPSVMQFLRAARDRIHLCGRLSVELAGDRIEGSLPGRQGRLLFAYLVLNRDRAVRRDELLDVLWPEEGPPPSGDSLLAPPLSRLRKALGAGRLEGRDELMLHLGEQAWVDWEAAGRSLQEARTALAEEAWRAALDRGQAALEIADRGLLGGLTATWIEDRRLELADMRLEALELVAGSGVHLGTGELARAEQAARAAVEWAPSRRSPRVALIDALCAQGNTAEALRAYEDIRVLLREELGNFPGIAAPEPPRAASRRRRGDGGRPSSGGGARAGHRHSVITAPGPAGAGGRHPVGWPHTGSWSD